MSWFVEIGKAFNGALALVNPRSFFNPAKPKITANIICKDSIKTIAACLESLHDIVDEIVVIDTGSSDGTLDILTNYPTVKLIKEPKFQGYSYHRNQAIANSNGDWILAMDSDEFISEELRTQLKTITQTKLYSGFKFYRRWIDQIKGGEYGIPTATYINSGKYRGRYTASLRLFRKHEGVQYQGDLHEAVFGLETYRIKKFKPNKNLIYHLDVAINSIEQRLYKVLSRNNQLKGSGHPEEYLPELFDLESKQVPVEDQQFLALTLLN